MVKHVMTWLMTMSLVCCGMEEERFAHDTVSSDGISSQQVAMRAKSVRTDTSSLHSIFMNDANPLSGQQAVGEEISMPRADFGTDFDLNDEIDDKFDEEFYEQFRQNIALTTQRVREWCVDVSRYDPVRCEQEAARDRLIQERLVMEQFAAEWLSNRHEPPQSRADDSPCCCGWC